MQEKKNSPFRKTRYYFLAAALFIGLPYLFGFYSGQTGHILVATDKAGKDPNFSKSVIYVFYNDVMGAQGIVLNKPLSSEMAQKVIPSEESSSYNLFKGGPVAFPDYRSVALDIPSKASRWRTQPLSIVEFNNYKIYRDSIKKMNPEKAEQAETLLPVYVGVAGWITGQLEGEIRRGVWRVLECDDLGFPGIRSEDLWEHLSGDLQATSCKPKNW